MVSGAYLQRKPVSGTMKACFQPLAHSQSANVVRLPLVFKPDAVRLGLAGQIIRTLGEQLTARGISFRFTAPQLFQPTRELVDHVYYEHSHLDPENNFARQKDPEPFFKAKYGPYMSGELTEGIQMPLISVIVEARAGAGFNINELISVMRSLIGETNPLDKLRKGAVGEEEKAKVRYATTAGRGARLAQITGEKGYNVEESSMYNRIHCPQKADEARIQLGLIYSREALSGHYDEATIAELRGSLPRLAFDSVGLLDLFEQKPDQAADALRARFPAFARMSRYEIELLARDFNLLAGYFLELEEGFYHSLGADLPPLAQKVTAEPVPPAAILLLSGPSGIGKTTLIDQLKSRGFAATSLPQYTTGAASPGGDRVAIPLEEALELTGQKYFAGQQIAPRAPGYFVAERVLSGFAKLHGGVAVMDAAEDMIRGIQEWAGQAGVVVRTGYLKLSDDALKSRIAGDTTRDREGRVEGALATNKRFREMPLGSFDRVLDASLPPEALAGEVLRWFAAEARPGAPAVVRALPPRDYDSPQVFLLRETLRLIFYKLVNLVNQFYSEPPAAPVKPAQESKATEEDLLPGMEKPAAEEDLLPGMEPAASKAAVKAAEDDLLPGMEKPAAKAAEEDLLPGMELVTSKATEEDLLPGMEPDADLLPGMEPDRTSLRSVPVKAAAQLAVPAAPRTRMEAASADDLQTAFQNELRELVTLLLYEDYRFWHDTPPETNERLFEIKKTAHHITQTMVAVMQGQLCFDGMIGAKRKLTRFADPAKSGFSVEQIERIAVPLIEWLMTMFNGSGIHYEEELLDALVHDLGKPNKAVFHEASTARLLARLKLPDYQHSFLPGRPREVIELSELVAAHHHTFGHTFIPDASLRDILTTFEDPQVRARLSNESGAVNQPAMERFLKRLLIIAISDVAGGPEDGNLSATGLITYRRNYELAQAKAKQAASYDAFLSLLGEEAAKPEETQRRFAMAPARCDSKMDANESLNVYWTMIDNTARGLVSAGEITEHDWQAAIALAPKIRRLEYYISFLFSVSDPATGALPAGMSPSGGGLTETEHIRINPNYIKYRILLGKIAQAVEQTHGKDTIMTFEAAGEVNGVNTWLTQLFNTSRVAELSVICEAREIRVTKNGETILRGTIEQGPHTSVITFKL